ncbi:MAG: hypothetical protein Q4G13_03710 [Moraxella sp.]|nr:hypothetical protein [Moraxella sp.]
MTKSLKIIAVLSTILFTATGCSTVKGWLGKRDNGSLDYQSAKKLAPIEIPVAQPTAQFTPLYPTPTVGENTLELKNPSGKQYQLPTPPQVVK